MSHHSSLSISMGKVSHVLNASGVMGIFFVGLRDNSRSWCIDESGLNALMNGMLPPRYHLMARYKAIAAKIAPTVYTMPSRTTRNIAAGPAESALLKTFTR